MLQFGRDHARKTTELNLQAGDFLSVYDFDCIILFTLVKTFLKTLLPEVNNRKQPLSFSTCWCIRIRKAFNHHVIIASFKTTKTIIASVENTSTFFSTHNSEKTKKETIKKFCLACIRARPMTNSHQQNFKTQSLTCSSIRCNFNLIRTNWLKLFHWCFLSS